MALFELIAQVLSIYMPDTIMEVGIMTIIIVYTLLVSKCLMEGIDAKAANHQFPQPVLAEASNHQAHKMSPISRCMQEYLSGCPPQFANEALIELLEGTGKAVTDDLLQAVRTELQGRNLKPCSRLSELMLRGYLCLGRKSGFDEIFNAQWRGDVATPSIAAIAMNKLWVSQ